MVCLKYKWLTLFWRSCITWEKKCFTKSSCNNKISRRRCQRLFGQTGPTGDTEREWGSARACFSQPRQRSRGFSHDTRWCKRRRGAAPSSIGFRVRSRIRMHSHTRGAWVALYDGSSVHRLSTRRQFKGYSSAILQRQGRRIHTSWSLQHQVFQVKYMSIPFIF